VFYELGIRPWSSTHTQARNIMQV
jgi:hypothetical protein